MNSPDLVKSATQRTPAKRCWPWSHQWAKWQLGPPYMVGKVEYRMLRQQTRECIYAAGRMSEHMSEIEELKLARTLTKVGDVPQGSIGTVVFVYPDAEAYEVEFSSLRIVETFETKDVVEATKEDLRTFLTSRAMGCGP